MIIIIGWIATASDFAPLAIRAIALIALWVWLMLDIFIAILTRPHGGKYRAAMISGMSGVTAVALMFLMWFLLYGKLASYQEEVYRGLTISAQIPERSPTVRATQFSISNKSGRIISSHQVRCSIDMMVGANGAVVGFARGPNGIRYGVVNPFDYTGALQPGGDSSVIECLNPPFYFSESHPDPVCVDITLFVSYEIQDAPGVKREKHARFLFYGGGWRPEPVQDPKQYCEALVKR